MLSVTRSTPASELVVKFFQGSNAQCDREHRSWLLLDGFWMGKMVEI